MRFSCRRMGSPQGAHVSPQMSTGPQLSPKSGMRDRAKQAHRVGNARSPRGSQRAKPSAGLIADTDWQAPLSPVAGLCLEQTRDCHAAAGAMALLRQSPQGDLVPVAADEALAAAGQ